MNAMAHIRRAGVLVTSFFLAVHYLLISGPVKAATADATEPNSWDKSIELDRIEGGTIYFKAPAGHRTPKPLATSLFETKYIGMIFPSQDSTPYIIISARPCQNCDQDKYIYILRPDGSKPTQLVYPGRLIDPDNGKVVYESRAFFGKCIPGMNEGYFVHQKDLVEKKNKRKKRKIKTIELSLYVAEADKEHLNEKILWRHVPKIRTILQQAKSKQCSEIEGRYRNITAKLLDLTPPSETDDDQDDDDTQDNGSRIE